MRRRWSILRNLRTTSPEMLGDGGNRGRPLLLDAPAIPTSVAQLRRRVVSYLQSGGVAQQTVEAVQLAVSEAVSNSVMHAYGSAPEPGPVTVELQIGHPHVHLTVIDAGAGMHPRVDSPGAGLGLVLIARLALRVEITGGAGGKGTRLYACFDAEGGG